MEIIFHLSIKWGGKVFALQDKIPGTQLVVPKVNNRIHYWDDTLGLQQPHRKQDPKGDGMRDTGFH